MRPDVPSVPRRLALAACLALAWIGPPPAGVAADDATPRKAEMAGYLLVPHGRVAEKYNAGFSMYVAAWPLLKNYPGQEFQSGLFGTWMFAQYDGPKPEKLYSDIEGGLGWWRDTRFATETPKFIMGGVALNFGEWANGPGAGKGRDWKKPAGHYAIAQLSPWVLWPPDGLNLKQGTRRRALRLRLPAAAAHDAQEDHRREGRADREPVLDPVPQHRQLQGAGDVLPAVLLVAAVRREPEAGGLFLDTRPSEPNKAVQMETQHIPAYIAEDAKGDTYARIAPTPFPAEARTATRRWSTASPRTARPRCGTACRRGSTAGRRRPGRSTRGPRPSTRSTARAERPGRSIPPTPRGTRRCRIAWSSFATPVALDDTTYGYRWAKDSVTKADSKDGPLVTLPEYYRLEKDRKDKERWVVVSAKDVPAETGLAKVDIPSATQRRPRALCHARRGGQLLEEAGAGGGTVRGETGGRQRGDLLLVSVRRPARLAERRPDRRRAGDASRSGWRCCTRTGPRTASTCRPRRSGNSPTSTRRCS